jgi:hypothetical protein
MTEGHLHEVMQKRAADIDDPVELIERVLYRESRLVVAAAEPGRNPVAEAELMTGFNKTDLHRLRELIEQMRR